MCKCDSSIKTLWCNRGECQPTKSQLEMMAESVKEFSYTKQELENCIKVITDK